MELTQLEYKLLEEQDLELMLDLYEEIKNEKNIIDKWWI